MTLTKYFNNPASLFWDEWFDRTTPDKNTPFSPKANIKENKKNYLLELDLPGVDKKDVSLNVQDGYLTIKGERKNEHHEEEKDGYYRYESSYGSFERSWNMDQVDTDNIEAEFKNGVLKLKLPKKKEVQEKDQVKKIEIK
ncbi:MAG TPA: Hsp20/alpha crystallin family protein [Spirochaetota bacterium]|nr:Hsp20/alpha crystallin family protein [Spirochaetota bacterium]